MTLITIISITIVCTIVSSAFYRLGGMGDSGRKEFPELPSFIFNTKTRDLGCPLTCLPLAFMVYSYVPWWIHLIAFLLTFAALTTYWDRVFGFDNHWFHGFMIGVAYIPYSLYVQDFKVFLIRCFVLAIAMGLVSILTHDDDIEELGRGAAIPATIPILFI